MTDKPRIVGDRIVVSGMAGAGKSTFSRVLAAKTVLPVIHLDLHIWNPGWIRVAEKELIEKQRTLFASEKWIVDSNDVNFDLLVERADTLIVLDTPWWLCAWRAFLRGLKRSRDAQLPDGCDESISQRLVDEWGIVWRNCRDRESIRERELSVAPRCKARMQVHVLSSKQESLELLERI